MKFKIDKITEAAKQSFLRFPFAISLAIFASFIAMRLVNCEDLHSKNILYNILIVSAVWFSPLISLQLLSESFRLNRIKRLGLTLLPLIIIPIHYWLMPTKFEVYFYYIQAFVIGIALHLSVSFAAFIKRKSNLNFWHFNQTLFIQFIISVFFAQVLYAGLALSLLSVEKLFNIDVNSDWYTYLFIFIAIVFNSWFFLSQIPEKFKLDHEKIKMSKFLSVFTKYILFPIVLIYLIILYLYIGKILMLQEWPKGWVSNLIISYSAVGIFTLLLSYPLIEKATDILAYRISKLFYISLFPLIIVLFMSIYIRINEYGITENRYYVIMIALWLMGISTYLLLQKSKNIKFIPISLSFLLALTSFGPWSSFMVSKYSQQSRFEKILNKYSSIEEGKISAVPDTINFKDKQSLSSIVEYLYQYQGIESLNHYFNEDLTLLDTNMNTRNNYMDIVSLMGFNYISEWETDTLSTNGYFNLTKSYNSNSILKLNKAEYYIDFSSYSYHNNTKVQKFKLDNNELEIRQEQSILILKYKGISKKLNLENFINSFSFKSLYDKQIDPNNFKTEIYLDDIAISFYFSQISGNIDDKGNLEIQNINADVFINSQEDIDN